MDEKNKSVPGLILIVGAVILISLFAMEIFPLNYFTEFSVSPNIGKESSKKENLTNTVITGTKGGWHYQDFSISAPDKSK